MSELANKARTRNWQKARLKGFYLDTTVLTADELVLLEQMNTFMIKLLVGWDMNTYKMLDKPMPLFKCSYCGKRGNVPHKVEEYNYCFKHYKKLTQK